MSDCLGCGAEIDCPDDTDFESSLTGPPLFPFVVNCPAGFSCSGGAGGSGSADGWTVTADCCGHHIERKGTGILTEQQVSDLIAGIIEECRQYAAECPNPPTNPDPIVPQVWFFNEPQTCSASCPNGQGASFTVPAAQYIAPTQSQANRIAHEDACNKARILLNCQQLGFDMPLDQAVYDPVRDVIFGVRGGYIFEFDASTGLPTANRSRFASNGFRSFVCYEPITDRIFVSFAADVGGWDCSLTTKPALCIYKINPATLAVETTYDLGTNLLVQGGFTLCNSGGGYFGGGIRNLVQFNGYIYGVASYAGAHSVFSPFRLNVTTGALEGFNGNWNDDGHCPIAVNASGYFFVSWSNTFVPFNLGLLMDGTINAQGPFPSIFDPIAPPVGGFALLPTNELVVVSKTPNLYRVAADLQSAAHFTLSDALATPYWCRLSPYDGLVYIPTFRSNKVIVWNPGTNSEVATKTGFDSPFDMVFTPAKAWAVQQGLVSLKEIT